MSADNPDTTDETDKPAPPRPVPAETDDGADVSAAWIRTLMSGPV
jgi:hypothetical protein